MRDLVSDELWATVERLLPEEPPKPKGGRPRCSDRAALRGIVFVLRSGLPWEMLPREVFGCSGMTCWRRLRDWQLAGVWDGLHRVLLERLDRAGELDWSRAAIDSASVGAKRMARPVGKWFVVAGLAVCKNVSGLQACGPGPRWRSARSGPHKGAGLRGHFVPKGSRTPVDCWAIFLVKPPADIVRSTVGPPTGVTYLMGDAARAS